MQAGDGRCRGPGVPGGGALGLPWAAGRMVGMRYADGPQVADEVIIRADLARVWELVTDIGVPARFSPELESVAWLDGADYAEVGARFEGWNAHPLLGRWRTVSHVVELVPAQRFAWAVVDADNRFGGGTPDPQSPMARWQFELDLVDGPGVLLRLDARLGPARSGLSLAIDRHPDREEAIVDGRLAELRTGIRATLGGVRELAEQDVSAARQDL